MSLIIWLDWFLKKSRDFSLVSHPGEGGAEDSPPGPGGARASPVSPGDKGGWSEGGDIPLQEKAVNGVCYTICQQNWPLSANLGNCMNACHKRVLDLANLPTERSVFLLGPPGQTGKSSYVREVLHGMPAPSYNLLGHTLRPRLASDPYA